MAGKGRSGCEAPDLAGSARVAADDIQIGSGGARAFIHGGSCIGRHKEMKDREWGGGEGRNRRKGELADVGAQVLLSAAGRGEIRLGLVVMEGARGRGE